MTSLARSGATGFTFVCLLSGCPVSHNPPPDAAVSDVRPDVLRRDAGICEPGAVCDCRATAVVPAGVFFQGGTALWEPALWTPGHQVQQTEEVFLARYEATTACFRRCIADGGCGADDVVYSGAWNAEVTEIFPPLDYWRDAFYDEYPVGQLTFQGAEDYCRYLGGRLPTSAEWEHAARGNEGLVFPWQEAADPTAPTNNEVARGGRQCDRWNCEEYFLQPVALFPLGVGPYGHLDIAGNAAEWAADTATAYEGPFDEPLVDPFNDDGSARRAVRGWRRQTLQWYGMSESGEFDSDFPMLLTGQIIGVRCAFDTAPPPLLLDE